MFPGQGSQFTGMGKDLFVKSETARSMFKQADDIMGFDISSIMFEGSVEDLKQTKVTQPAVFIHSVINAALIDSFKPDMVAGHSLGEFSALVANKTMTFEEALKLVSIRATAMQKACELVPSTMAAVLGMADDKVEEICAAASTESGEIVVAANYNCPGQIVISGSIKGVELASVRLKEAGAKRALLLPVGGAFHSPLMEPARRELADAIEKANFSTPICPIYQNVSAKAELDPQVIKNNLVAQLTAPVRWTQSVISMVTDGGTEFIEVGPGNVLQGLVNKINNNVSTLKG